MTFPRVTRVSKSSIVDFSSYLFWFFLYFVIIFSLVWSLDAFVESSRKTSRKWTSEQIKQLTNISSLQYKYVGRKWDTARIFFQILSILRCCRAIQLLFITCPLIFNDICCVERARLSIEWRLISARHMNWKCQTRGKFIFDSEFIHEMLEQVLSHMAVKSSTSVADRLHFFFHLIFF